MTDRIKSNLGWVGDVASIVIIPLAIWGWFTIQQSITLNRTQSESSAKDCYVAKSDFKEAIIQLASADAKAWAEISAVKDDERRDNTTTAMELQHLKDIVSRDFPKTKN